jgi:hypothetical protein
MIAASMPVADCCVSVFSPQCGPVAAFGEISRPQVLQLINYVRVDAHSGRDSPRGDQLTRVRTSFVAQLVLSGSIQFPIKQHFAE